MAWIKRRRKKKKNLSLWVRRFQRRRRRKSRFSRRWKILSFFALSLLFLTILALITALGVIAYFAKDLPSPTQLSQREVPQSTKIYSRQGDLLYEVYTDQRRTLVDLNDIPQVLIDATLAVEDAEFYQHRGFDLKGILYALYRTLFTGNLQGGSTISQQLVKNVLLSPERTLVRKIKEFILALEVERRYSKDEILQMYLNEVPYGGPAWGVGAASEMYFGKHVRDLNLAEAALLAGLPQSPSLYSPYGAYPENAKARQEYVLKLMVKHGFITPQEAEEAKNTPLNFLPPPGTMIKAPHFVMYVKNKLVQEFGEKMAAQGGLRVWTTLDMNYQRIAEEEVRAQLERLAQAQAGAGNAGLVAVDPRNGQILAMVGSRDYFDREHDGNVNVVLSPRQPGSSIKPIMYITAFTLGYTPATFLSDIYTCWPDNQDQFCPTESDGKYWGPMLLYDALANSRNVPAVKMLQLVGIENVLEMAHQLGITTLNEPQKYGLSLTLGGGEVKLLDMVQAFSVFAAEGIKYQLKPILRVEDSRGRVIRDFTKSKGQRVLEAKYTYLLTQILADNKARQRLFGPGNLLEIGRPAAVKTGTTNDNRDAWTIGYTPQLVAGVWVGNNDNSPMAPTIQGSTGATPIWHYFMQRALENEPVLPWSKPAEVKEVVVDALSGKLPQEEKDFPRRKMPFIKGTEPTEIDDFHITVEVCPGRNLLATDYHRDHGLAVERTYRVLKELNPDWQPYTDRWMEKMRRENYGPPPTEKCPIMIDGHRLERPLIEIVSPEDEARLEVYGFPVEAKVYSNSTITKVQFYWDDVLVDQRTSVPYRVKFNLSMNEEGAHQIKVRAFDSEGDESSSEITVYLPQKNSSPSDLQPTEEKESSN